MMSLHEKTNCLNVVCVCVCVCVFHMFPRMCACVCVCVCVYVSDQSCELHICMIMHSYFQMTGSNRYMHLYVNVFNFCLGKSYDLQENAEAGLCGRFKHCLPCCSSVVWSLCLCVCVRVCVCFHKICHWPSQHVCVGHGNLVEGIKKTS
jgi:hypothetical protein